MNYAQVIEYVKEQTSINGRPPNYPFRSRFEHTMRVYRWAIKLQDRIGGDLEIIALAAIGLKVKFSDLVKEGPKSLAYGLLVGTCQIILAVTFIKILL